MRLHVTQKRKRQARLASQDSRPTIISNASRSRGRCSREWMPHGALAPDVISRCAGKRKKGLENLLTAITHKARGHT